MLMAGCSSDDDHHQEVNDLTGQWKLTSYTQSFDYRNYEQDEIHWSFHNGNIFVEINGNPDFIPEMPFQATGNYDYFLDIENSQITIANILYEYFITDNGNKLSLIHGDPEADGGHIFAFDKIE